MALTIVQAGMGGTGSTTASSTGTGAAVLATQPSFPSTIGVGGATAAASGSGITFPATQSASTDANTLDDYEEGTWTPNIKFGGNAVGVTYDANYNRGWYTKVGNLVTCTMALEVTNKGSSTGNLEVTNLPFTSSQGAASTARNVLVANLNTAAPVGLYGTNPSGTYSVLRQTTGALANVTNTDCSTSFSILATIVFLA